MPVYGEFAEIYARGDYPAFSVRIAEVLPPILERFDAAPQRVLDAACGEGSFAVAMAARGVDVTGIDASPRMIALAGQRAAAAGVSVRFLCGDMRHLPFRGQFDLVTCWYDSLNYLVSEEALGRAFGSAFGALAPGGLYAFDMNTTYGLAVNWRRTECYVQRDDGGVFEVHRPRYDFEADTATLRITAFLREGEHWRRVDEQHHERGYRIEAIRAMLQAAGFAELGVFASLRDLSPPSPESGRLFFYSRRPFGAPGGLTPA
ncbi:MAG: class I SAM-dependent methyltransferase [Candidatus Eisenbacteria bacterium]|nr:class I SAM-dependent methyltransferase [Candidatus Eisenbacteria bacterium]